MFCRISANRLHGSGGEMKYYPFRLTPYQLTLRDSDDAAEPQPCCLLIAERVHSGYEGKRTCPSSSSSTSSSSFNTIANLSTCIILLFLFLCCCCCF